MRSVIKEKLTVILMGMIGEQSYQIKDQLTYSGPPAFLPFYYVAQLFVKGNVVLALKKTILRCINMYVSSMKTFAFKWQANSVGPNCSP